jgi:hypothetical protein
MQWEGGGTKTASLDNRGAVFEDERGDYGRLKAQTRKTAIWARLTTVAGQ